MGNGETDSKKFYDKSIIHIQKGKVKKAIKELLKALRHEPWNIDVAYQIVSLYQRMNDKKMRLIPLG